LAASRETKFFLILEICILAKTRRGRQAQRRTTLEEPLRPHFQSLKKYSFTLNFSKQRLCEISRRDYIR
jgi:hypothetical protein